MRIVADVHERGGAVPRLLSEAGVSVEIKSLSHGDYAIGGGPIVERKTVGGLHAAIINASFWPQLGRLRLAARMPYLPVEGIDLDLKWGKIPSVHRIDIEKRGHMPRLHLVIHRSSRCEAGAHRLSEHQVVVMVLPSVDGPGRSNKAAST